MHLRTLSKKLRCIECEKIFITHRPDKAIIPRTYRKFLHISHNNQELHDPPSEFMVKGIESIFRQRNYASDR